MVKYYYINQTTPTEEPTLSSATLYELGLPIQNVNMIDWVPNKSVNEQEVYNQFYPNLSEGNKTVDNCSLRFIPVNARFLYWFFGKRTASTGVRTITNMDGSARKPRVTLWKEISSTRPYLNGFTAQNLQLTYENGILSAVLNGKGMNWGYDSATRTGSFEGSISTFFNTLTGCTWNTNNISPTRISYNFVQNLEAIGPQNGVYIDISEFSPQNGVITIQFIEGETYIDNFNDFDDVDLIITFKKADDTDKYITITNNDCKIKYMEPVETRGMPTVWTAVLVAKTTSINVKDGL